MPEKEAVEFLTCLFRSSVIRWIWIFFLPMSAVIGWAGVGAGWSLWWVQRSEVVPVLSSVQDCKRQIRVFFSHNHTRAVPRTPCTTWSSWAHHTSPTEKNGRKERPSGRAFRSWSVRVASHPPRVLDVIQSQQKNYLMMMMVVMVMMMMMTMMSYRPRKHKTGAVSSINKLSLLHIAQWCLGMGISLYLKFKMFLCLSLSESKKVS